MSPPRAVYDVSLSPPVGGQLTHLSRQMTPRNEVFKISDADEGKAYICCPLSNLEPNLPTVKGWGITEALLCQQVLDLTATTPLFLTAV